jgi:hypothetical protein
MKAGNITIGYATIDNVLLKPGNNSVSMRGIVDLKTVIANLGPVLAAESSSIGNGDIGLSASGNSTIYEGKHILYFEKVLNNLTITAQVPLLKVLLDSLDGLLAANSGLIQNITSQLHDIEIPPR